MWHKSHCDSEVVPSTPPPPHTHTHAVTMYVCMRPGLFLLHILCILPSPIQSAPPCSSRAALFLLLRRHRRCRLSALQTSALALRAMQSANGLPGCGAASSRRPSSAAVTGPRAAGDQRQRSCRRTPASMRFDVNAHVRSQLSPARWQRNEAAAADVVNRGAQVLCVVVVNVE